MQQRFEKESTLYNSGIEAVIGVDEVGRGPLVGPVVAGAVMFNLNTAVNLKDQNKPGIWWEEIKDSKKISEKKRVALTSLVKENSLHGIGVATVEEIEELNILQASLLAMSRAVSCVVEKNNFDPSKIILLVDGKNIIPGLPYQQEAIVAGDSVIHSIAAASIIAKTFRDNLLVDLSKQFPEYLLEKNKGYGTKVHIEAIKKFGLSPIHRKSFCKNLI